MDKLNVFFNKIKEIKINGLKNKSFKTNCYINFALKDDNFNFDFIESKYSLLLVVHEYKVDRLYFYTCLDADLIELSHSLKFSYGTCDIISKNENENRELMTSMGFSELNTMLHISTNNLNYIFNNNLLNYSDNEDCIFACREDADDIYNILWKTFDTRISHLPSKEEIFDSIEKKEFIIYKENNVLLGLTQFKIEPKKYYLNQIINISHNKYTVLKMVSKSMKEFVYNNGKYAYAWVAKNNIIALLSDKQFGLEPDGLFDIVYVKK